MRVIAEGGDRLSGTVLTAQDPYPSLAAELGSV
jgi:hypothetical protein